MNTIKEENRLRIKTAYNLCKFCIKFNTGGIKITDIFANVASFLGYSNLVAVSNIYYKEKKKDGNPVDESKMIQSSIDVAYEN